MQDSKQHVPVEKLEKLIEDYRKKGDRYAANELERTIEEHELDLTRTSGDKAQYCATCNRYLYPEGRK